MVTECIKLLEERSRLRGEIQRQLNRERAGLPTSTAEIRRLKETILDHHDNCKVCNG